MLRSRRALFWLLLLAGMAAIVLALYGGVQQALHTPGVSTPETERFLEAQAGQTVETAFALHNSGWRTARVVGLAEC